LKFQAVAQKTAKDARGLLYFAAPGISVHWLHTENPNLRQGHLVYIRFHWYIVVNYTLARYSLFNCEPEPEPSDL